ncbi:lysophospholipid acyltransferase family protein [Actinoplanes sp. NEAU-A12]|uniref:Lysophospholipid acyltransferase family protein n=1 Tax=Actinoplanes sandaracinus TaxID=3045177 RepID=A0ABT6WZB8_9ACTN|nr:lysophospholipid acyltransferase family protein [Actinoplanes sandaracinus]MDI6105069.1 lysophospholipid acyltransferase family protein [Actinoplanes sandaracinus]
MDTSPVWRVPRLWRLLLALSRIVVFPLARLRVTNGVPEELRGGPVILAANHVSPFDPVVLMAACHKAGVVPRIMATGGVFRTPVVGAVMRHCGHIRVDRNTMHVADALPVAAKALAENSAVLVYPEGRIGLDPWMWPERGKTGTARMAQLSGAPVLPVAQWGTHAVIPWEAPKGLGRALVKALVRRPVVQVRFGDRAVDLAGAGSGSPGAQAMQGTRLIMEAIDETLTPLRLGEMQMPRTVDTSRPHDLSRVRRRMH